MSKPTYEVTQRYQNKAYDRISIVVPKGRRKDIADYTSMNGETINGLVNKFLQTELGMSQEEWKAKEAVG